jgi:hypothetical protein
VSYESHPEQGICWPPVPIKHPVYGQCRKRAIYCPPQTLSGPVQGVCVAANPWTGFNPRFRAPDAQ